MAISIKLFLQFVMVDIYYLKYVKTMSTFKASMMLNGLFSCNEVLHEVAYLSPFSHSPTILQIPDLFKVYFTLNTFISMKYKLFICFL